MRVLVSPLLSRAERIAAVCPSIMSEGATISAPACACERAMRASTSSVASLSTSLSRIMPQCPCEVYSHMQTSPITVSPGNSRFAVRIACCITPFSSYADVAHSSLCSGMPNNNTPPILLLAAHSSIRGSVSGLYRFCPGIAGMSSMML